MPLGQRLLVQGADTLQVGAQGGGDAGGQHGHPILVPFGLTHRDLQASEVDIFDPQPQAFQQAQARAVEQPGQLGVAAVLLRMRERGVALPFDNP